MLHNIAYFFPAILLATSAASDSDGMLCQCDKYIDVSKAYISKKEPETDLRMFSISSSLEDNICTVTYIIEPPNLGGSIIIKFDDKSSQVIFFRHND